jgi:serine/threonine-protein kinase RsbW
MAAGISVKLIIPSDIKLVDLAHAASERVAELAGLDEDQALNVGLAVREAVINAVLHGNHGDPALKVTVTLSTRPGRLRASVRDEGNGFDPSRRPDPTAEENLLRSSGRGLLLIEAFVDELDIRKVPGGGTEVVMVKRLPAGPGADGGTRVRS